jgi:flagellar biosynthetic protein FliP
VNPAAISASPASAVQMVVVLAIASLLPAIILTCTCFARFLVVFSFLKNGLGTQGAPPNQILVGLALFMTMFVMAPVATKLHEQALKPYLDGKMNETAAIDAAGPVLKDFLLPRTRQEDLSLFYEVSNAPRPTTAEDVPLRIAIPAFVLTELRTAFMMGLAVLLPFLVIDLIVATVLSSLGMVMLPPVLVSLPVKLLIFVAVDGWHLLVGSLLRGVMA